MIHFAPLLCDWLVKARNVNLGWWLAFRLALGCQGELAFEELLHHRGSCDLSGVANLETIKRVDLSHMLHWLLAHSHHEVLDCFIVPQFLGKVSERVITYINRLAPSEKHVLKRRCMSAQITTTLSICLDVICKCLIHR